MKKIEFYSVRGDYGEFSSFYYGAPFTKNGKKYKTREHWFQSQKFPGTKYETEIANAKGPMEAANLGRDHSKPLRKDWENIKFDIMYQGIRAQCEQNPHLLKILLDTEDAIIIEHTDRDNIWGDGGNGKGQNLLGKAWMKARDFFKNI